MGKKYNNAETESMTLAEPVGAYNISSSHDMSKSTSKRDSVIANTVSVDEYFDELISLVHKDYASL